MAQSDLQKKGSRLLAFVVCCVLLSGLINQGFGQEGILTVKITGVASDKGKLMLAVFKEGEGFPFNQQRAVRLQQLPAQRGEVAISFAQLPPGRYALAVYHDENADNKLNTSTLGIPKEGYGFSNNIRPKFSAPKFEQAAFDFSKSSNLSVRVRY